MRERGGREADKGKKTTQPRGRGRGRKATGRLAASSICIEPEQYPFFFSPSLPSKTVLWQKCSHVCPPLSHDVQVNTSRLSLSPLFPLPYPLSHKRSLLFIVRHRATPLFLFIRNTV